MTPSELGAWDSDTRGRKAGVSTLLRALGSSLRGICLLWGLGLCFYLIVFCPFHKKAEFRCLGSFPHKRPRILRLEGNTSTPLCLIWMRCDVVCPRHLFWVCELRSKFSCVPTFSLLSSEAHFRTFLRILCLFCGRNTSCLIQASHFVSAYMGGYAGFLSGENLNAAEAFICMSFTPHH